MVNARGQKGELLTALVALKKKKHSTQKRGWVCYHGNQLKMNIETLIN